MRNPKKLRAFELADELAIAIYKDTTNFPASEQFGLTSQLRRAAVSIPSNIVEGCAKSSSKDYLRFLEIAYGSACELQYQISLAYRLEFINGNRYRQIESELLSIETSKVLSGLIKSLRSS